MIPENESNSYWDLKVLLHTLFRYFEFWTILCRWIYLRLTKKNSNNYTCLIGKTAIVTGGSSGLGQATAILLASRGCRVIIANRRVTEEYRNIIIKETNNPNIITKSLDLSSLESVRNFAEEIKKTEPKIDILINNAGISDSKQPCTKDGLNTVMQTNFFGPFLLTHLLLDSLKVSGTSRIIFTSSGLASLHELNMNNLNPTDYEYILKKPTMLYSNSKTCSILAAQGFAKRVCKYGITAYSVDPGISATPIFEDMDMGRTLQLRNKCAIAMLIALFKTDEFEGSENTIYVSTSNQVKNGEHYFRCTPFNKPWICNKQTICDQIWERSEELVRLRTEEKLSL